MGVEESLRSLLIGNSSITAIVGQRVYPLRTPENPIFPFIVYDRVSTGYDNTFTTVNGLAYINFDITIATKKLTSAGASGYDQARTLARLVSDTLNGYVGIVSGVDLQAILLKNESQDYDPDIEVYEINQDFLVICDE